MKKIMTKRDEKVLSEAYDKIYDLNSVFNYAFNTFSDALEKEVKLQGYEFKLNDRTQKWKLKQIKEE